MAPTICPPNGGEAMYVLLTIVIGMMLIMSLGTLYVHLVRSVREFRAGYSGLDQELSM